MADDQDEETLDLTIEALTGTVYDLCVSPYETILGIKMKIQSLEGIPVYQQQLVYGGTELQDELCLAEYTIPSGAQLKLLIAMRGGPIHAQRVHLELEDPTLMEIAEFLDSQAGEKYTVMLVRNGDDLDTTGFVHIQMRNEDSCESVSCSPMHISESHKIISASTSEDMQIEHGITRDKVKDLMAKLKKVRSFRQPLPKPSSNLQRKGTSKVLLMDSRASSRLYPASSRGSPLSQAQLNEPCKLSNAQRKLLFSPTDEHGCCHCSQSVKSSQPGGKRSVKAMAVKPTHSTEADTPVLRKDRYSRVILDESSHFQSKSSQVPTMPLPPCAPKVGGTSTLPHPPGISSRSKPSKRIRRNSHIDSSQCGKFTDSLTDLSENLSRLGLLDAKDSARYSESSQGKAACVLPHISSGLNPVPLTTAPSNHTRVTSSSINVNQGSCSHLPPIARSCITATKPNGKRKNRCMWCGKKIGLASVYSCRCGGLFCAVHRYAESHSCTFDYKMEGRRMIARNNPVVTASKLPKI